MNGVLGGWQISGIVQVRSGNALLITQPSGIIRSRPDVVPGVDLIVADWKDTCTATGCNYLNTAGFVRVPVSADDQRHASSRHLQSSIWRAVPGASIRAPDVREELRASAAGRRLQVRADVFNVLNRKNYNNPQLAINNANFGRITGATAMRRARVLPVRRPFDVLERPRSRVARAMSRATRTPHGPCPITPRKSMQIQSVCDKTRQPEIGRYCVHLKVPFLVTCKTGG